MAMLSCFRGWLWAVPATVLSLSPSLFYAQTADPTPPSAYRTSAAEVRISFFATDEANRLVTTVDKNDFAVIDDETIIRDFRSLNRSHETALDLVLMLDTSQSIAARFPGMMREVLKLVSSQTPGSEDHLSVIVFGRNRPSLLCSDDCRTSVAQQRLLSLHPEGPTPLFDALAFAANFVSTRPDTGARRVLLLFSDGDDTFSGTSALASLDAVIAGGTTLYTIDLGTENSAGSLTLQQMAQATGGRAFSLPRSDTNFLAAISDDLRASYVVTYQLPSHVAGFHTLCILPKHNLNLHFHCRRGYVYDNPE